MNNNSPDKKSSDNGAQRRRNTYQGVRHGQRESSGDAQRTAAPQTDGMRRRVNPIEAARRKKERKLITYAAAGILLAIAILVALIAKSCGANENTNDFRVTMEKRTTVPYADVVRGGTVYINATRLASFCEMTVSGSYDALRLSSDAGAYADFVPDSNSANVNGTTLVMSAPAVLDGDELWLPCDFVSSTFIGVGITVDREKNRITVERNELEGSTAEKPLYAVITFTVAAQPVKGEDSIDDIIAAYEYKTDISAYAASLDPSDDSRYLLLVNKTNPLGSDYVPSPLVSINSSYIIYSSDIQLEKCAEAALCALMTEMRAAGFDDIFVTSGYRSYAKQNVLFNTYINKEMAADASLTLAAAIEKVKTYSALAGTSEHQSGLCVDLISSSMKDLDETFALNPVYAWLNENAAKFGFVLRFPETKESTTGYTYEPWHYRFVGRYHATAMKKSGMCLEEYIYSLNNPQ